MASAEDRYIFTVEWFDAQADLIKRYSLTFFPRDNTIEMYDMKNKRPFLKRSEYGEISLSMLYIGAMVTVLGRQLKVIDYADSYSRKALESRKAKTLAIVKPDAYDHMGHVLSAVTSSGFVVTKLNMLKMTPAQAQQFCRAQPSGEAGQQDADHLCSDVVVVMELVGDDAVGRWLEIIGPRVPAEAQSEAPRSLRAMIGRDEVRNAVHGSVSTSAANQELELFFGEGKSWPTTALFNNCTCCVVRPHAFQQAGEMVTRILSEGFEISAMRVFHLDKAMAEEFLEVYKGVLPEYHEGAAQLCTGACLVMEVRQEDAVASFRRLVGPHDPEVAKHLRPDTLRARYGVDRVRNAVHCTDLPEDGLLEVEYFFNILYNR